MEPSGADEDGGGGEIPIEGVRAIAHTADIGIEVTAPDLPELFRRAALGTLWMVLETVPDGGTEARTLEVEAEDDAGLLRSWLREILYWEEVEGFAAAEIDAVRIGDGRARGLVRGGASPPGAVREIKGVTWHGLAVEPTEGGWTARVIFDV